MKIITLLFISFFLPSYVFSQNLVSINPSVANAGQTLIVDITGTGTNFTQASGTTVGFSSSQGINNPIVNSKIIINDTSIQANITVPSNAYTGYYNLFISNSVDGFRSLNNGFYVNGIAPVSLVSISPSVANAGQTLTVNITGAGTNFTQASGTTVGFSSSQSINNPIVNSKIILNDSAIQANITVPANAYTGTYSVFITNATDGFHSLDNSFHVTGITHPTLASISPAGAQPGQTLNVSITGTNTFFTQASATTSLSFSSSQGINNPIVNSKTIINDSAIIANITVPSNANIGIYKALVSNSVTGSIYNDFLVFDNCFSHFNSQYDYINNNFTLTLDSLTSASAVSFYWDFGDGTTSTYQTPTHTFLLDTLYNVCLNIATGLGDTCSYCREIGKNSFGDIFKLTGFTVNVVNYDGTVTGISQTEKKETDLVMVYPNPANDLITISINKLVEKYKTMLSIYGIDGQLIFQQNFIQNKTEIDISYFPKGIYLLKMISNENTEVVKFVKH